MRNRFGALASWWFAFTRDLRRERTFTSRDVGVVRDVYGEDVATMIAATKTAGPPRPPVPQDQRGRGNPPATASDVPRVRTASRSPHAGPPR